MLTTGTDRSAMSMLPSDAGTEDSYEDWKQIDGIFASMGVDEDLCEENFLNFLKKDQPQISSISCWLTDIGLGQYENVLIANGFDNINFLNGGVLEETELMLMGCNNMGHINKILVEITKLPAIKPIAQMAPPSSVREWLSSLNLEQYTDKFYSMDYTTISRVQQIWEVELATVLSVVLLGHQKRILVSLGDDRSGFNTLRRKQRENISDISRVFRINDVKVHIQPDKYFKHNFDGLKSKTYMRQSASSPTERGTSPAKGSLERSDSGCSIGSDSIRPEPPERTSNPHSHPSTPELQSKKNGSTKHYTPSTLLSLEHNGDLHMPYGGHHHTKGQLTKASYERSRTAKQLAQTISDVIPPKHLNDKQLVQSTALYSDSADYANLTEFGVPLIGNIDGLRFSNAQRMSKRVLTNNRRPLPETPTELSLSFTAGDLPQDFKGKHKPEILINGCVNYTTCYLGTCLVNDITSPESTREAIAKMKRATEKVDKLPLVTLSISLNGVNFIDYSGKQTICDHEITNIYGAAQDSVMMNYFAYITKDDLTNGLYCHVFCVKSEDMARDVIMTLGEAFDIAYYAVEKIRKTSLM